MLCAAGAVSASRSRSHLFPPALVLLADLLRSAAREASRLAAAAPLEARNKALSVAAGLLGGLSDEGKARAAVLEANAVDVEAACAADLPVPLQKRLGLASKADGLVRGLKDLEAQPDPLGKLLMKRRLGKEGPMLRRVTCPIGVLLIVFESRPDAVIQIASLCIKSGNAVILKGGKEAQSSNRALVDLILAPALAAAGLPPACVQLVEGREEVADLLSQDEHIDLVIPRGSAALVRHVKASTRIPVMGHSDGLCAAYLHADAGAVGTAADADAAASGAAAMSPGVAAARIVLDSKTQYPAACNAVETVLVSEADLANEEAGAAGVVIASLLAAGVRMHCDAATGAVARRCSAALDRTRAGDAAASADAAADRWAADALANVVGADAASAGRTTAGDSFGALVLDADEASWDTEFLAYEVAIKTVPSLKDAAMHVGKHGSGHTEVIVTADREGAGVSFQNSVGSSSVFVNMSTRFADGFRYGFGAEVGISTARLHARGPVGLEGLTTYKYLAEGAAGPGSYVAQFEGGGAAAVDSSIEWAHEDA